VGVEVVVSWVGSVEDVVVATAAVVAEVAGGAVEVVGGAVVGGLVLVAGVVGAPLVKGAVTSGSVLHAAASRDNATATGTKRNMSVFVVFFPEVVYAVPTLFKPLVCLQCRSCQRGYQHAHSNSGDEQGKQGTIGCVGDDGGHEGIDCVLPCQGHNQAKGGHEGRHDDAPDVQLLNVFLEVAHSGWVPFSPSGRMTC